ncbi:hypothetical protein LTR50_007344 [Elasticomyces elasticus]|nr:hypothetical protein LTR50_007344 [Elasticomyces elasticus]
MWIRSYSRGTLNATYAAPALSSTPVSTVYRTSTEFTTISGAAASSPTPTIPTSSYISLITTGLDSLSSTLTPYGFGRSYTWSQVITPTYLGKVYVIIDNLNHTTISTSTDSAALASNTHYLQNGTLKLLHRTDVNEAGTVTRVVPTGVNGSTVVAYPTPFTTVAESLSWSGSVPTFISGVECCSPFITSSPVPQSHYPFPSSTGSTDSRDPSGWLYDLIISVTEYSGSRNLSSLLAPATINSALNYCPFQDCDIPTRTAAAAEVEAAADLLTTTVHVTVSSSSADQPTSSANTLPLAAAAAPTPTRTVSPAEVAVSSESQRSSAAQNSQASQVPTALAQSQASPSTPSSAVNSSPATISSAANAGGIIASVFGAHATVTISPAGAPSTAVPAASQTAPVSAQSAASAPVSAQSRVSAPVSAQSAASTPSGLGSQSVIRSAASQVAPISVGSTAVPINPVSLTTSISGSSVVIPGVIIGSQTVPIGATVIVGSTPVALITSNSQTYAVIGSSTSPLQYAAASAGSAGGPAPLVIGSSTVTPNSASQYIVSGQTLAPGSSITIGSGSSTTVVGLQITGSQTLLVVGSSTSTLQVIPQTGLSFHAPPTPITIGSAVLSPAANSGYIFGSQVLSPGGSITLGSGASTTVVALQTSGSETLLIVGSSTSTVHGSPPVTAVRVTPGPITVGSATITPNSASDSTMTVQGSSPVTAGPITVGSATITPNSVSAYVIGSQTLSPGGPAITVSGTRYSLQTSGSATLLIAGSSTMTVQGSSPVTAGPITVGSATITPNSASEYVIGSQTLSPGGPAITVSGTRYSLAPSATQIVIGSSTEVLVSGTGLASYIWNGIGGNTGTSTAQATATGGGSAGSTGSQNTAAPKSDAADVRAGCLRCPLGLVVAVFLFVLISM